MKELIKSFEKYTKTECGACGRLEELGWTDVADLGRSCALG